MRTKSILTSIFFVSFAFASIAQVKVQFSESLSAAELRDKKLDAIKQQQVEAALTTKLAEYIKRGKLLNPNTRKIDRESVNSFKELFSLDAKLFNDLREIPEAYLQTFDGYVDLARSYFAVDGLTFGINSASIEGVEYNEVTERYTFSVLVSKTVERFFKDNGAVVNGVHSYNLEFLYTLKLDELDNARITTIRLFRGSSKPADLYTNMFSIGSGVGYGIPSFSETPFFKEPDKQGNLDLSTGLDYSLGLNIYSNFFNAKASPNKSLFFVGGVTGFYQQVTGKLRDYSTSGITPVNGEIPETAQLVVEGVPRVAQNVNVDEKQTLMGLRVPVGFGFRVFKKNTSSALLNLQYCSSYILSSRGVLENGTGDYGIESDVFGSNFNSFENNAYSDPKFETAYGIGINRPIKSDTKISSTISHGLMLSGMFFKDIIDDARTYGIAVGLQYYLPFTNPWEFSKQEDQPFLYPDQVGYIEPGVLSPFIEGAKLSHVGISFHFYYKKTKQP